MCWVFSAHIYKNKEVKTLVPYPWTLVCMCWIFFAHIYNKKEVKTLLPFLALDPGVHGNSLQHLQEQGGKYPRDLPLDPGVYVLVFFAHIYTNKEVKTLGTLPLDPGVYVLVFYVHIYKNKEVKTLVIYPWTLVCMCWVCFAHI